MSVIYISVARRDYLISFVQQNDFTNGWDFKVKAPKKLHIN